MRSSSSGAPRRSRLGLVVLASALALLGVLVLAWRLWRPAPAGSGIRLDRANVLLVTIDTLRDDRVGPELTPAIEALAAQGVRFAQARTVAPLTLPAHASLLTGRFPPGHGVRLNGVHRLPADVPTLATSLRAAGYRTGAFIGAYVLDRRFGLAPGFDTYDDEIAKDDEWAGRLEAERPAVVVADRAAAWLDALPRDDRPFLLWVHMYDPHAPYAPPALWLERAHGQPYEGEIAYADAQVGRLFEHLRARGVLDRTLIVVAGDHGESLGDHGEATHGLLLYEPAIRIPLVFAHRQLAHARREDAASLVDVLPSILGALGVAPPPQVDGRNLFAAGAGSPEAEVYAETRYPEAAGVSPLGALVSGRWKYIGGPALPELYDLDSDPTESRSVAAERQATADAMGSRLASMTEGARTVASEAPSPEVVDRLRALGYVATAPSTAGQGATLPSPVTIVREWARFEGALSDLGAGRRARALETLAALVEERPDARVFHATWARLLAESGDVRAALEAYRAALHRWPQDTTLLRGYAVAARDAGSPDEAMKVEEAVLAIDPTDAAAQNGIGLLHADAGRAASARSAFERAVQLDPHVVSYWVNLGNAHRAAGDAASAERAYRDALRLDPASADGANGLGVLLVQAGRIAEAIPLFERALSSTPHHCEARLNLGIACQEAGDRARAADAYRRVLADASRCAGQRRAATELLRSLATQPR